MAARKQQQDIACMLCFEVPCACPGLQKKTATPRKKLSQIPTQEIVVSLPEKLEVPKQPKSGISKLLDTAEQVQDEGKEERAALTALFKGGFILEPVGDTRGFESVRPKLDMTPVDVSIQLWKIRRRQWLTKQEYKQSKNV